MLSRILAVVCLAAVVQQAVAQDMFEVGISLDGRAVENAGLQPRSADQISEYQFENGLFMRGALASNWLDFDTDYRLIDRRFTERSFQNDQALLGQSTLIIGPRTGRYFLQLDHSTRETLLDPAAGDLPANRDSRTMLSATGRANWTPGQGNLVDLWLGVTDIRFDQSTANDASRVASGISYARLVSPLVTTGVEASAYRLNYRELSEDLDYASLAWWWQTQLRMVGYGVHLGVNQMERGTDRTTSPVVRLNLEYQGSGHGLNARYAQFLSDSSQGGRESISSDLGIGVDGRLGRNVVDQYRSRQLDVDWRTQVLCVGCRLVTRWAVREDDYVSFPEFSFREWRLSATLEYQATRRYMLFGRYNWLDYSEYRNEDDDPYFENRLELGVRWLEVVREGSLEFYVGGRERRFDVAEGYTSGYVGLRFFYGLYRR